ncbi:MAG: DNA-3-methyladenine glycosylase 2 family protein [Rhodobacteraceae bacterium]|nr:DNA-3-methyladenine glycosylase 2 family protein [Paracoccaceae bacterium]
MRRVDCAADLEEGVSHLIKIEPRFAHAVDSGGPPPLRRRHPGFAALLQVLVEQQVSVAAGLAIWGRIEAAGVTTPEAVLARDIEELRSLGLSRPKARYAREAAAAIQTGSLDFDRLAGANLDAAMAELTAITGVGRWTAEIYLMFCDGRADLLPVGDIALQEAARALFELDERPKGEAFDALGAPWSPWRSVAARVLWAYYRTLKGREGKV